MEEAALLKSKNERRIKEELEKAEEYGKAMKLENERKMKEELEKIEKQA